jgi:hypothetical protein
MNASTAIADLNGYEDNTLRCLLSRKIKQMALDLASAVTTPLAVGSVANILSAAM